MTNRKDIEDGLLTSGQKFKRRKWEDIYVPRSLIESKAVLDLKTAAAYQVLMIFMCKRQMLPIPGKPKRRGNFYIANNGKIEFTYLEAEQSYGFTEPRFTRAIDELMRVGIIDIKHTGCGLHKDKTLYALSDRWKAFGTDEFFEVKRPRRKQHLGFARSRRRGKK